MGDGRRVIKGAVATLTRRDLNVISISSHSLHITECMFARTLIAAVMTACVVLPASAGELDDVVGVTIIPGWREADGRHIAGLKVTLAPGWKTYWRAPGEGGIPPIFNWSGSSNVAAVGVHYPVPVVFDQNGIRSIGYQEDVVFPLIIDAQDNSGAIRLRGEVEMGVCHDICIPVNFRFDADLGDSGGRSEVLAAALADRPKTRRGMRCEIEPIVDGLRVGVSADMAPMRGEEVAVVEAGEYGLWISEASVTREGGTLSAVVEMVPPNAKPFALARSDVRLTVLSDGEAVELTGCN